MFQENLYSKTIESPVGKLRLIASDKGLRAVLFDSGRHRSISTEDYVQDDNHPMLLKAEKQLIEYFSRARKNFDLPLDPKGTVFQIKAWRELSKIPYGKTISYGEQAKRLGDSNKARAVGMANGRNPLSIVVPCHRVIGASGHLTGFGGGMKAKEFLLSLEQAA